MRFDHEGPRPLKAARLAGVPVAEVPCSGDPYAFVWYALPPGQALSPAGLGEARRILRAASRPLACGYRAGPRQGGAWVTCFEVRLVRSQLQDILLEHARS